MTLYRIAPDAPINRRLFISGAAATAATVAASRLLNQARAAAPTGGAPAAAQSTVPATGTPATGTPAAATPGVTGQVGLPDTALGRELADWITAMNANDPNALLAYYKKYGQPGHAEGMAAMNYLNSMTFGTLVVRQVKTSSDTKLTIVVEATRSEDWLTVNIEHDGERRAFDIMAATPPPSALPEKPLGDQALANEMTRYLEKLTKADVFSGAVLVARQGKPIFTYASGQANVAQHLPNQLRTRFNLGSMNKMMTGVAIGQLAEAGKLAYTDTIARHLPDYPADVAKKVTIHQLLTHTSGLGDFFGPDYDKEKDSLHTLHDYLKLFIKQPLQFTPGARFQYSNAGYIVLGLIIEQISGQDYFTYVRERISRPAGMMATDFFERDAKTPDLALGYTYHLPPDPADLTLKVVESPRTTNDDFLSPRGTSAGGGYSTVEDLLRFHQALRSAKLVNAETVKVLIDGKVDASPPPGVRYGYGFIDDRSGHQRIVGHNGGAPGISAVLDMYWDLDATVVALGNIDYAADMVSMKTRRLLAP